jgi:hypothetical protein
VVNFMVLGPRLVLRAYVPHPDTSFLEWIAYHRAIGGVRHEDMGAIDIMIFTDPEPFAYHPLLNALSAANVITLKPVKQGNDNNYGVHDSAGNYGLTLAPDEYLCIHDRNSGVAAWLASSRDAKFSDFVVPMRIAGMGLSRHHSPGAILQHPRALLPSSNNKQVCRVHKPGSSRAMSSDSPPPRNTTALILKVPAPCIETFLLRQQMLPAKMRFTVETQIERLSAYVSVSVETFELEAWRGATARQIATLLALPDVDKSYHALCNAETTVCEKLRASSPSFQRVLTACATDPEPQSSLMDKAPTQTTQAISLTMDTDEISQADVDEVGRFYISADQVVQQSNMGTSTSEPHPDVAAKLPLWLSEIHMSGENEGFYTRLKNHSIVYIQRDSARLMVTFDNLSNVDDTSPDREPWAYKFVRDNNCSHLSVMARRKDWYRDPQLIRYLQRLSVDGFFAGFEKVTFAGTSMGGFAALAFSSLSPGATVISFSPQTTLEEALVPWETRFAMGRARDWSLPHSDCSYEIDDVKKAFVLYDPFFEPDRRHIERLENPNVVFLKTWCSGHFSPVFLRRAGLLKPLMQHAFDETLTPQVFYDMFRARRMIPWYRKSLISNLQDRGHHKLATRVTPAFRKLQRQAAE